MEFGKEGGIVISGGTNEFFISKSEPIEKDSIGWEYIQLDYTVPKKMNNKEIGIYLFYNG